MNSRKKILIVDEEITYRELLRETLGSKYIIIDTDSYSEAVTLVEQDIPDLVIIDVEISGKKGVELCKALKDDPETRDVTILLITSLTKKDDIILGLQAGASDYIIKPMCLPEVVARVESHLRSQEDYAELEHKDLLMLLELTETISVTRNPNAILRLIVNKMSKIVDVKRCSVIGLSHGRKVTVKASSDLGDNIEIDLDLNKYPEIRKAIETKNAVIINDIKNDPIMESVRSFVESLKLNSVVVIPLIKKESVIGTFFLRTASQEKGWINNRIIKLSQLIANIAANALENSILFESMKTAQEYFEELSIVDDLTKLFNRRHFYGRLEEEFRRAVRHNEPLSLVFIDVDNFKQVNDTYGHAVGDFVLREIGRLLKEAARTSDLPSRCGGDEFAILLPTTNRKGALDTANRILSLLHGYKLDELNGRCISVSAGVSTLFNSNVDSVESLIKLADDAMYASKAQGKGQVVQAEEFPLVL